MLRIRLVGSVSDAFTEMAIGSTAELLPLPNHVSFEVAASQPIAYLTARMAIVDKAKVQGV
ncbi:MAG: hypothetical protein AB4038_16565 [Prochloraceae cyanobacterium]